MREWKLQEITYKVVKERQYNVAVLPVGSTEAHGLHVPYGSDALRTGILAERICERAHQLGAKVILLPTIPYGVNSNSLGFPLTINVHQKNLNIFITDIVKSLEQHGILKLVILNGHGGNNFTPLMRELYGQTKVFITTVDWWKVGKDVRGEIFEEEGEHADEMETSVGLEAFENLIHLEDADDGAVNPSRFEALNRGWATIARPWHLLTKNSGYGNPHKASKEKGKRYIDIIVERVSNFIKELSDSPMDEKFPY